MIPARNPCPGTAPHEEGSWSAPAYCELALRRIGSAPMWFAVETGQNLGNNRAKHSIAGLSQSPMLKDCAQNE
jgi:hypothetical protein